MRILGVGFVLSPIITGVSRKIFGELAPLWAAALIVILAIYIVCIYIDEHELKVKAGVKSTRLRTQNFYNFKKSWNATKSDFGFSGLSRRKFHKDTKIDMEFRI